MNKNKKRTHLYQKWDSMKQRCFNKNTIGYKYYGERGINICDKWINFNGFKEDMYESYVKHCKEYGEKNTTIDRIDPNGNYEKLNCRWANYKEQANNTRRNHLITYKNKTLTVQKWSEKIGISANTIIYRLKRGWSIERALSESNSKSKRFITFNGKNKSIVEWAKYLGLKYVTLETRLRRGWSIEKALEK